MADRVVPLVRLLFPCDTAVIDLGDLTWELKNPLSVVSLPPGAKFPIRAESLWVFAILAEGVGEFDIHVEMRQLTEQGRRTVGASAVSRIVFPSAEHLLASSTAFDLSGARFREAGLYEFYAIVEGEELRGCTAELRFRDQEKMT